EEVEKYLDLLIKDLDLRNRLIAGAKILAQKESIITLNKKLLLNQWQPANYQDLFP
ncbi:MAG: hypothetical protein RIS64_1355, partial [Bacteroidota bacterium]